MEEIWKEAIGYEGCYMISNLGRVKNMNRIVKSKNTTRIIPERFLKIRNDKYGYPMVHLSVKQKVTYPRVHKLVAKAFIPNPNNYPQINHKNGIKTDNRVKNLEWCTNSQNITHAFRVLKIRNGRSRKVNQYDLDENFIKTWDSIIEACNTLNIGRATIGDSLRNRYKNPRKFIWKYAD